MSKNRLSNLRLGQIPRVVGSISQLETLSRMNRLTEFIFDVAEVRWDKIGTGKTSVLSLCRQIGKTGTPVILTIRSAQEGGGWDGDEERRLALYEEALPYVSVVDVEIGSSIFKPLLQAAHKSGKAVIGSFHDFEQTPEAKSLLDIVQAGRRAGADIVKIATMIHGPSDVAILTSVLTKERKKPLCVIGMGPQGVTTRVTFACKGSCLTYGYADRTAAPGQTPSSTLIRRLRKHCPAYEKDYLSRHGLSPVPA